MNEELAALFRPRVRPAIRLKLHQADADTLPLVGTHFGGRPYAEAGEIWPVCPTCANSLTFIGQVDMANDAPEQRPGIALWTFFYCWECFPWGLDKEPPGQWLVRTYAAPHPDKAVRLTPPGPEPQPTNPCTVTTERVTTLPDWEGSEVWAVDAADLSTVLNEDKPWEAYEATVLELATLHDFATFVGGYPHWIQSEDTPRDTSGLPMRLLAQIDTEEDTAGFMWGDTGCVYLFASTNPAIQAPHIAFRLQCF